MLPRRRRTLQPAGRRRRRSRQRPLHQPDIDPTRIGLIGASQAGWIVPLTAARTDHVAFTAMVDAPAVSYGLENAYSRLTGEEGGAEPRPDDEIAQRLASIAPTGFDPAPWLQQMTVPVCGSTAARIAPNPPPAASKSSTTSEQTERTSPSSSTRTPATDCSTPVHPTLEHSPTIVDWISRHVESTQH